MRSISAGSNSIRPISSRLRLTASALVLAMAIPGAAVAQSATTSVTDEGQGTEVDEIVVTGLRRGLADSIATKRRETSIVEAVSAEDIGKLPDVSIAESIARLPGLAAQRVNGRAQVISIRGLAPDFTTTLLNGRQQASSGDNRAVEFDQYPSELLSGVVIYKTPDAEVSGMGLSGTADLRTVRPLAFGTRAVAVNMRGEMIEDDALNDDVRNYGGRFSISYIDQLADGTLGVALGYAHLDSPSQNKHYKAYGYEAFGGACEPSAPGATCTIDSVQPDSADTALLLNGQEVFATSRLNQRDAVIGILEWRPTDQLHSTLDVYYSKFEQEETTRGAQWFSNPYADDAYFTDVVTEERGGSLFGRSGTINNAVPILRNDYNTREDEIFSIGLNTEYEINDRTRIVADLSYSNNRRRETILETYAGYGLGVGGVTPGTPNIGRTTDVIGFTVNDDGYPTYSEGLDYADASQVSLGDRAPWGGWGHDGAIRFPDVEESITSADLKIQRDMDGFFNTFTAGVNHAKREKSKRVDDYDLFLKNGRQQVYVDPQYLETPVSLAWAGFGDVLAVDMSRALDVYYDRAPILDANYFDKNWDIEEQVTTAFVKLDFEGGNWRGNVGMQAVVQDQQSTGVVINGTEPGAPIDPISVTKGADYLDILPSLNLIYDLGGGHRLRFAASRTMARPRMDEMRANVTPGFNSLVCSGQPCPPGSTVNPWSASGGNPELEPWRANAFDLAYEWYVDSTTYLSIAGFYKDLETYIYVQNGTFDFSGIPLPSTASSIPSDVTISPIGQISLPANGDGGTVQGLEVSGALNFGTVWAPLDGLGMLGSISFTESDLNPAPDGQEVRIAGLSGTVYNITGYYERGGFQARISKRFREAFKGEVVQLFATRGYTEILDDEQIDAQIGYTFEQGPLEGLGVLFQVNNLTNSPYRTRLGLDSGGTTTADGGSLPETYEEYGRQFLFGVNYRF
ncbi:TonB-dependent receptor [Brevundimonas sp.]|jgi:iron complex outermembrane recepter protein|uniref:TonB-dependent receptor n=1 Tax=Brevundimonas sp. TaxID=1871086 RepID=UPI001808BA82|nr:TonB-dependent receptor [Brevundimonas sp.]MBA4807102.1 TonB-dependent receptor [Brevundimonas sp.]